MASRSSGAAISTFQHAVHAAFSCLTPIPIRTAERIRGREDLHLSFVQETAFMGRNRALQMRFQHSFLPIPTQAGWAIRTTGYAYWLLDGDGAELVLYQWDPNGAGPVKTPHLHVGKAMSSRDVPAPVRQRFARLAAAHLPTGIIPVTDILRMAIRDFGAAPRRRLPSDANAVDWDGVDRLFQDADATLRTSFV